MSGENIMYGNISKNENIKISILIYVLNGNPYIEKCVRSAMEQTLHEIEILIVDGGSTDGTLEIVELLAVEDSRIRIFHSLPGVGLQFNTGLREAEGKYIVICESDDYILPGMCKYQYEIAEKFELDILRADAKHFFEMEGGKELFFSVKLSKQKEFYNKVINTSQDMRILKLGINSFWSGLYRRNFLLEHEIFMNETQGASYQDTTFSFLSLRKARRVMLSKEAFYCYRLDNPDSSVNNPQKITVLIEEYQLLKERLLEQGLYEGCKEIYLSWKINGYLGFYDSLSYELRKEFIVLMYKNLYEELTTERFSCKELSIKCEKIVNLIMDSFVVLREYMFRYYKILDDTKQNLKRIELDKKIVIFGNGELGYLVYLYLLYTDRHIAAFADNNEKLWGVKKGDIPVLKPEEAVKSYPEAVYIIANEKYSEMMKIQLQNLKIKDGNMIECNDYGYFRKHILQSELRVR